MDFFLKIFGKWFNNIICKKDYYKFIKENRTKGINERPIEYLFVFRTLTEIFPKTILDVGTGLSSLPHLLSNCGFLVTAIDNIHDFWPRGMFNKHYYVFNDDITNIKLKMKFDFITCVSVLEHIKDFDSAIKNMVELLNDNGHLILTFPYNEETFIENVYKLPNAGYGQDYSYLGRVFSRKEVNRWIKINNLKIKQQEYWQVFTGDYWTFGKKISPARQVSKEEKHQLSCILIQKQ